MRRGRTGLGGWRNENPRHFRPRGGGTPHYRPPRSYGLLDAPRFPPPGHRLNRPPHFSSRPNHGERNNERNQYISNHQNNQHVLHNRSQYRDKNGPRQTYPYNQQIRYKENDSLNPNSSNFYKDMQNVQSCLINNTVNIDHRNSAKALHNDNYEKQNLNSTWSIPVLENKRHYYEDQSPSKMYRQPGSNDTSKIPFLDYPGHRPPSSDYYGGNPSPVTNNNTSFSRSVDDTVDIVRKRLLNRNESQTLSEDCVSDQSYNASDTSHSYQKNENETPVKKKILRQKQTIKSNCDKIKNKIVHQLFKMDKDKIHKLMDNPNSSTKFEYAISSLITESQISLNRHLRSVAEKSLCSSSSEFIQNNSNTIYEDTFMKQMQCILDPQDTILLEDMKPLVMAELSKFLQIEEYDPNYDVGILEDHVNYQPKEEIAECQYDELYQSNEHSRKKYSEDQTADLLYSNIEHYSNKEFDNTYQEVKPVYERRTAIKCHDYSEERRQSSENRRKSLENKSPLETYKTSPKSLPLFEPIREQLTEEEDPFAELDKQYHVPVDHNFIQTDIYASLEQSSTSIIKPNNFDNQIVSPSNSNSIIVPNHNNNNDYESNIQSINISPLNLPIPNCNEANDHAASIPQTKIIHCDKKSPEKITDIVKDDDAGQIILNKIDTKCENTSRTKYIEKKEPDKNEVFSTPIKSCTHSNSRKRSMDQRPSHRKEKRKKSESKPAPSKPELPYKNSDVNLCHSKSPEKDKNSKKSFIYSYFSKNRGERGITKEIKKVETTDKTYSDKYVRRKEVPKNKENELSKKRNSDSLASPKENSNSNNSGLTPTKSDTKVKLKPIDMFEEQSKKVHLHQAHRNTALPTLTPSKTVKASIKNMTTSQNIKCVEKVIKKLFSRETQTHAGKSSISKFCQTENKQFVVKAVQTDPVFFERFRSDSTDTFERMKEIDLEIQVLLQEKFKLYSSLENKDSCQNSMQTLGMTVLNVAAVEETRSDEVFDNVTEVSADAIVDDFTNIPVEELEQIALESLSEDKDTGQVKRTRRPTNRMLGHRSSFVTRRCTKKANPPNISLLEQIITDDRPLEDIILLDELENCSVKKKPQLTKKKATKRSRKFVKKKINLKNFVLKDCSVVLEKINIDKHLIETIDDYNKNESDALSNLIIDNQLPDIGIQETTKEAVEIQPETTEIMEEDNNIQFDMLDVSEDIVIGDNCEVKDHGKGLNERIDVPITEEIILDNSQSSYDDLTAPDSGQGENECKMYDYSTDENLRRDSITVTGNADAVLAIECVDNNFIAASLDGNVYHFNSDGQLINTLRGSNLAVTCLTIVKEKYGTTVYTGSLDSRIRYYDLETGVEKGPECNVLSPIQTMDRAWDTIFVGTRTGFVLQFECKNNMLIPVSTVKFSEQSILALRAMKEGPRKVLLVAARSENVTIKDAQTGLLLRTLMGPKMTVYTLLFEDGKVYCGTSSHQIHVFEYTTGGHVGSHEGGKGAVCLRATGGLLFAGCYDGCVYVYREGETRPLAQLRGPSLMLLSLAVVGSKIIAGYKDRSLYIWKIPLNILQEMIL